MKALALAIPIALALTSACSHINTSLPTATQQQMDVGRELRSTFDKNAPPEAVSTVNDAQSVQTGGVSAVPQQLSKRGVPSSLDQLVEQIKRSKQ